MEKLNDGLYDDMYGTCKIHIEYNYVENPLTNEIIDLRSVADQYYGHVAEVNRFSYEDLLTDKWGVFN